MRKFQFKTSQLLPVCIDRAWSFFSTPQNLSLITPPEMDLNILKPSLSNEIYAGMLIDYRVKPLWGISMHWQSEIAYVDKPFYFVDTQRHGPYRFWEHRHSFYDFKSKTLMIDHVIYQMPYGMIGTVIHKLMVKKRIEMIFSFRRIAITSILNI